MNRLVCEGGGYEVLLHGGVNDAARAVWTKAGNHAIVTTHGSNVQKMLDYVADTWRTGQIWWPHNFHRDAVREWFATHDLKGNLKPERERMLALIALNAVKELNE